MLLRLELFILVIIRLFMYSGLEIFYSLMIICIGACEGAVGLACMIGLKRVVETIVI